MIVLKFGALVHYCTVVKKHLKTSFDRQIIALFLGNRDSNSVVRTFPRNSEIAVSAYGIRITNLAQNTDKCSLIAQISHSAKICALLDCVEI